MIQELKPKESKQFNTDFGFLFFLNRKIRDLERETYKLMNSSEFRHCVCSLDLFSKNSENLYVVGQSNLEMLDMFAIFILAQDLLDANIKNYLIWNSACILATSSKITQLYIHTA